MKRFPPAIASRTHEHCSSISLSRTPWPTFSRRRRTALWTIAHRSLSTEESRMVVSTVRIDEITENASEAPTGDARWAGITRPYSESDVERLRPSIRIEHTLADAGARRLWSLLTSRDYVP